MCQQHSKGALYPSRPDTGQKIRTDHPLTTGPWRHAEAVEFATLAWVDWFNNRRLLEPIGWVPPVEYEEAYYQAQDALPKAA